MRSLSLFLGLCWALSALASAAIAEDQKPRPVIREIPTEVLEIRVVEKEYTAGKRWDRTPGATLPRPEPQPRESRPLELGGRLTPQEGLPISRGGDPDSGFESTDMATASLATPASPSAAVGTTHIVDVAAGSMNIFDKSGMLLSQNSVTNFFSNLSPAGLVSPRTYYDHFYDRFFILAVDGTHLYIGGSSTSNPLDLWYVSKIPTLLQNFDPDGPAGPAVPGIYQATSPAVGFEPNQIYVSFVMKDTGGSSAEGTTVWNIWKDSPSGGLYGGGFLTINAAIRPFSLNNDYGREVPLTPVRFMEEFIEVSNRGMLFLGYSGMQSGGGALLQVFWIETIGAAISKAEVPLGNIDSGGLNLPTAPQKGSSARLNTGTRIIYDAVWQADELWFVTGVSPPTGIDSGEATVHWIKLPIDQPLLLGEIEQGNISGDEIVPDAHTYFPSIAINSAGKVGVGYSLSAPEFEVSSFFTFLGNGCDAGVVLAPSLIRRGMDAFVYSGNPWGLHSSTSVDPASDNCFWAFNAHAIARDGSAPAGSQGRWGTAHRRFCNNLDVIFRDNFETGTTAAWCGQS